MQGHRARQEKHGGGVLVTRSFRAHPSALRSVRSFVRELAAEATFHDDVNADLVLAVSEAAANSALHSRSGRIVVSWRPVEQGAEVLVQDDGVFVPPRERSGNGRLGVGLPVIRALCDEVTIHKGTPHRPGTRVRLVKYKR
jgi:anti-sigma regulatory factor (Ser/Thr protein kinase)